jgi:hypothetical protein
MGDQLGTGGSQLGTGGIEDFGFDILEDRNLRVEIQSADNAFTVQKGNDLVGMGKIAKVHGKYKVADHTLGIDVPIIWAIESHLNERHRA